VVAGATAFSQYSTTAPATRWRQVPWREKPYLHIVVGQNRAGVKGEQRKSVLVERSAGAVPMHVTEHPAGHITAIWR
jgi:hypothetical protein